MKKKWIFAGTLGVGIIVFIISYSGDNVVLSATLLVIAVTLQGTIPAGPMATLMDMSPNFSGKFLHNKRE